MATLNPPLDQRGKSKSAPSIGKDGGAVGDLQMAYGSEADIGPRRDTIAVTEGAPHKLQVTSYRAPTFCDLCNEVGARRPRAVVVDQSSPGGPTSS